jgi:hypothetical protein
MPDAKVKVDVWLWPMIGWNPIILVFWARNGRGYGPRLTILRVNTNRLEQFMIDVEALARLLRHKYSL